MRVIERDTQKAIDIDDAAFNPALHERIQPVEEVESASETITVETLRDEMQSTVKAFGTELREAFKGAGAGEVNRSKVTKLEADTRGTRVEEFDEGTIAAGEGLRCRPTAEARYDRLPDDERRVRSYLGDLQVVRWLRAIRDGDRETLTQIHSADMGERQQSVGTAADGGYLTPKPLANYIALLRDKFERIAPRAMTIDSDSTTIHIPTEATVGAVAAIAENAAITPADSTWGEVVLTKVKAGRAALISNELLNDQSAAFSVVQSLTTQCVRKLGVYWDAEFATGTGITDDLEGNSDISEVAAAVGDITRGMILAVKLGVASEYRDGGGCFFMGAPAVTAWLAELADTTGRPIYDFANNPAAGLSDVNDNSVGIVEGAPYLEVPFGAAILMYGRLSEGYAVLRDQGVSIATDASSAFLSDQLTLRVLERRDGAVIQAAAFAKSDTLTGVA